MHLPLPGARVFVLLLVVLFAQAGIGRAGPKPDTYWNVDELRPGMKGYGRTVMRGTKIERFGVEVLGVLKNTSPGRDLVLCRLSGLNLEQTGVIAGMSGSPVTIDNKLVGAVAFAWPYGKEPIAGVTPFCQMHAYVEAYERRDLAEQGRGSRVGLATPVRIDGKTFEQVTVAQYVDTPADDSLWMVPLRTPLCATGFTPRSLALLRERCRDAGLVPVQGGGAGEAIVGGEKDAVLEPGGPLAVALITGDFDLSGIGTVTHIDGNRVYGWGHPFMGVGRCEFPMMTGYIHAIYPRLSVSFKMGSPLRTVGVLTADVSTGVAGWLDRKPDLMPLRMRVRRGDDEPERVFNVQTVRQRTLLPTLVYTALTNAVDMEGDMPDEMTAELKARIDVEGHSTIELNDTYSGSIYSGGRAPQALYNPVASLVSLLVNNPYQGVRINRIDCDTTIRPGRQTADIESVELDSENYAPGETVKAAVFLRPYKGPARRLTVSLELPADLPEGSYSATVCDDTGAARLELRDNPTLSSPQSLEQVFEAVRVQTAAKRTNLVLRVPLAGVGVALGGKSLPNLPPGMVQVLGGGRRTGAQTVAGALVARRPTEWVVQGSETVRFSVSQNKRVISRQ